jgi:hypothetical protein
VRHYFRFCTSTVREKLVQVLPTVPAGVFLSVGAGGCGKTSRGASVVTSTTNAAVNNGCNWFQETLRKHGTQDKYLAPRLRTEWLGISAVLRLKPHLLDKTDERADYTNASSRPERASKYLLSASVPSLYCK